VVVVPPVKPTTASSAMRVAASRAMRPFSVWWRAALGAGEHSLVFEQPEIPAHGRFGDLQARGQGTDVDGTVDGQDLHDLAQAFGASHAPNTKRTSAVHARRTTGLTICTFLLYSPHK
jgi:hypothetical protein